jgi:CheY-like chemotaxis protein
MDWNRNPILLVEDNAGDADLTLMALNRQGLGKRVVHMRDGVDALDYLHRRGVHQDNRDQSPVVMFLDLKMPMFDGFAVIREVRGCQCLSVQARGLRGVHGGHALHLPVLGSTQPARRA